MLALGKADPNIAMGAWTKHCCPINVGVESRIIDPRTGAPKTYWTEHFASDGGSGALKGYDGWQGIAFIGVAGEFMRPNVEMYESNDPALQMIDYCVLIDWEGAGEFRGAPGTYTSTLVNSVPGDPTWLMTGNSDGEFQPSRGVAGGGDTPTVKMWIEDKEGNFIEPFDYKFSGGMGARGYYDENNAWIYRRCCTSVTRARRKLVRRSAMNRLIKASCPSRW